MSAYEKSQQFLADIRDEAMHDVLDILAGNMPIRGGYRRNRPAPSEKTCVRIRELRRRLHPGELCAETLDVLSR